MMDCQGENVLRSGANPTKPANLGPPKLNRGIDSRSFPESFLTGNKVHGVPAGLVLRRREIVSPQCLRRLQSLTGISAGSREQPPRNITEAIYLRDPLFLSSLLRKRGLRANQGRTTAKRLISWVAFSEHVLNFLVASLLSFLSAYCIGRSTNGKTQPPFYLQDLKPMLNQVDLGGK
jgi:hypothetical protein